MAKDIIDTLHPEGSLEDNFYPNVKKDNIPDGAIDASKIANGSVLNSKIGDEAVTQDKLANELYNSLVTTSDEQTITGQKTFTAHIKNDEIDNTNGNAMLRYKSTENKVVVGGSTIPTTIMGSGDRPTYSKDGSDFNGSPLALLSDVDNKQDKLTAGKNIKIEDNVISATSSGGGGGTKLYKHIVTDTSHRCYIQYIGSTPSRYDSKLELLIISTRESAYADLAEINRDKNIITCLFSNNTPGSDFTYASFSMPDETLFIYCVDASIHGNSSPTSTLFTKYYCYAYDESWNISDTVTEL